MDRIRVTLCEDKGHTPMVCGVLGTWCNAVMHGVRAHMGAHTAPLPPLELIEYGPAPGPMTGGALPPCFFPFECGVSGSCMGLEGTWGPVLHAPPPRGMDGISPRSGA